MSPVLNFFRGDTGSGEGLLTASLVLAIMIIPIVAATTRDLLRQVPRLPKEGALALGMNDWEVARKVSLPWVRAGIIGASVLGPGPGARRDDRRSHGLRRRPGHGPDQPLPARSAPSRPPSSASSTVPCPMAPALPCETLAEFALVLAVITLLANVGARLLVRRVAGTALPVGRGV